MVQNNKAAVFWKIPLAVFLAIIHFTPIYILIGVAFKSPRDVTSRWILPGYIYKQNFDIAINKGNMLGGLYNSAIITICCIALITVFGALASYPLARNRTRFNGGIKAFILGIMMVPPLSILVPLYTVMAGLKGTSTYWGIILIITTFQLPMSIFLYTNFIAAIPTALDEAASIDGCGPFRTFFLVILPQLKPITASVVILTGINCWNDYQFSLYMLQSPKIKTITLAISSFFSQSSNNVNAAAAAALMGILPVIILFLALQKYFIKGMVDSAIK
ncbi:carbohydrate ABC transporter permease [Cellulosilyticum sp. I15G10I2]|uniref:carbohydrate ABC transporter permease n=1 Tax=Cellulosilyticum sp. I15G10I2 TaxID=1892843 RepID=UPI00085C9576|nr:carbohydrate ABC transporter permease [Cellulosilyticum sp. I15G10I2]